MLVEQRRYIPAKLEHLNRIRGHAHELQTLAGRDQFDPVAFGRILHESWQLKRQLASTMSTSWIDEYYELALRAGAEGGKICGAGNGGFLLFIVQPDKQPAVGQALAKILEVPIRCEVHGSRVLLPFDH